MASPVRGPLPQSPEWFAARLGCIGASEMAAAIGLSPDRQPIEVYREKIGETEPFAGNRFTRRGSLLEPLLKAEYEEMTGHELVTGLPLYFHPEHAFVGCTPDARRAADDTWLVEFKSISPWRASELGEAGTDDLPPDWVVQAQTQMAVMGAARVDVFVALGFESYRIYPVERNERLILRMLREAADFWDRVLRRDPPPIKYDHPGAGDLIREIYGQPQAGLRTQLSDEVVEAWVEYQALGREESRIKAERKALKARVDDALGRAMEGSFPSGKRGLVRKIVNVAESFHKAHTQVRIQEKDL